MRLTYCVIAVLFFSSVLGQIATPQLAHPTVQSGPQNGGQPFPVAANADVRGVAVECTITFSHSTRITATNILSSFCQAPGTDAITTITCTDVLNPGNSTNFEPLFNGTAVPVNICPATTYSVSMTCGSSNTASPDFTLTGASSEISVTFTHDATTGNTGPPLNLTGVPIVDFLSNPIYTLTATVSNIGCGPATAVDCTFTLPPLTTGVSNGIIQVDPTSSAAQAGNCNRLASVYDCPGPLNPSINIAVNGTRTYQWIATLTDNGELRSTASCTAQRIGNLAGLTDEILAYGIGFIDNSTSGTETIGMESDNTDDLVINTIIPLSVFGGIMLFLVILAAVTVGVYIFVKKVILSEENVGF